LTAGIGLLASWLRPRTRTLVGTLAGARVRILLAGFLPGFHDSSFLKDRNFIMLCAIVNVNRNATASVVGLVLHHRGAISTISPHHPKFFEILFVYLLPLGNNLRQCE
jgi:hypothetical protein